MNRTKLKNHINDLEQLIEKAINSKGGAGSGNFNHGGRPGHVGGSGGGGRSKPAKPSSSGKKPPKEGGSKPATKPKPSSSSGSSAGESSAPKMKKISRSQALEQAKKEGFRPTSSDKWINEQQAIEYLDRKNASKVVAKAQKEGFKPTSSDHWINEMQARDHLAKMKQDTPKINTESKPLKRIKQSSKPPKTDTDRKALLTKVKKEVPEQDLWENKSKVRQVISDFFKSRFGKEPPQAIKKAADKVINKLFSDDSMLARVMAFMNGEKQF